MRRVDRGSLRGWPGISGSRWLLLSLLLLLAGCGEEPWNDPYADEDSGERTIYSSFSTRPQHLDPVRAYSSDEYAFIAQIYEPPLQYHFLKRPYQLGELAAAKLPELIYLDAEGHSLPDNASDEQIAFSEYTITLRDDLRYQPHPALALNDAGQPLYLNLGEADLASMHVLADFPRQGSRAVTAADYAYQLKRLAFSRLSSPIRGLMSDYILGLPELSEQLDQAWKAQQKSAPEREWLDLRPFDLPGVQVVDDHVYRIRIKGRYPQFVYWLAMPFFAPMPWEAEAFYGQPGMKARNITLDWFPIGSGPFMLTENNPNLRMVLARNPNFHAEFYPSEGEPGDVESGMLEDAGKPLPLIERAVYSLEKESIPRWNKFLQGWYDASGIGSDSFDQAVRFGASGEAGLTEAMEERGIRLVTSVETSVFYLGFNMLDPVLGGDSARARKLRQAISIAVDYEEFISIFLNGRGVAAQSPLPPGIFGNREGAQGINPVVYENGPNGPRRRPMEQARQLMVEAGYPGGRDPSTGKALVLHYDTTATGPDDKARLNWMRKQLDKIGVDLVIRATDYNRFKEKMRTGTEQIYMWGWNADYPDPENFLFLLYGPNGKVEHSGENASNYMNAEFDALFDRMKNLPNSEKRLAIIDRMNAILRNDAPWAFGFFPKAFSLHHGWYHNVKPNLMANNTLKYKRVDNQLRQQQRREWNPPIVWPLVLVLVLLVLGTLPAVRVYRQRERSGAR